VIPEVVPREIHSAGKGHRFAAVRRNVLWACAVAAALLVAVNVAYFSTASRSESPVAVGTPTTTLAKAPPPPAAREQQDAVARRAADRTDVERERSLRAEELRKNTLEESKDDSKKEALARKLDPAAPMKEKSAVPAPVVTPDPKPAPAPEPAPAAAPAPAKPGAPPPAPKPVPATVPAPKDEARPAADQPAPGAKREPESVAKQDADLRLRKAAEQRGEPAPTHLTLASTQMAKARPVMEQTLKSMGVALPAAPSTAVKAMTAKSVRDEAINLELTDAQIARLQQELEKLGTSRLLVAKPDDPVLAQFGDSGLFSEKKGVASGGSPTTRGASKAPEAPKPAEAAKTADAKGKEKDGQEAAELEKPLAAEGAADKAREVKRKVVLHLVEVASMPDTRPAPDPVKK
jgi:hypothetical protein